MVRIFSFLVQKADKSASLSSEIGRKVSNISSAICWRKMDVGIDIADAVAGVCLVSIEIKLFKKAVFGA